MKSTSVMTLAVLISTLGTLSAANYESPQVPTPDASAVSAPSDLAQLTGTVQSIDKANKSLLIQNSNGEIQNFKVGESTVIMRDGLVVRLSEIQKDDYITVKNVAM